MEPLAPVMATTTFFMSYEITQTVATYVRSISEEQCVSYCVFYTTCCKNFFNIIWCVK